MNQPSLPARYLTLREKVLSSQASATEVTEFEQLTMQSELCRKDFLERLHQESVLLGAAGSAASFDWPTQVAKQTTALQHQSPATTKSRWQLVTAAGALAASILLLLAGYGLWWSQSLDTFRITDARNCQWAYSTVPISEDRPLRPGRLVLNSGIAVLQLPNVEISIEGGCDIEVVDMKRCRLHRGRAYAEVQPGGEGFVIETPTSVLIDRGTAFTVNVAGSGNTDVTVVKGVVDVQHRISGESVSVNTHGGIRSTENDILTLHSSNTELDPLPPSTDLAPSTDVEIKQVQISTAVGNGKDCYVIVDREKPETVTAGLLLVKNTGNLAWQRNWRRRAYLHFDLSSLKQQNIVDASLNLEGVSSGIGFLSRTPDTTFAVYGLTDQSLEDWDEQSLNWETSPGFLADRLSADPAKTVLLGRFSVSSAGIVDRFSVQTDELKQFLADDQNAGATMIIVSETIGPDESWVHGFASRRHPVLTPPTLRLTIQPNHASSPQVKKAASSPRD